MAGRTTFTAWDAYLDGQLARVLNDYLDDGLSYEQISRTLYKVHDIDVSKDTVKRWCKRPEVAAA